MRRARREAGVRWGEKVVEDFVTNKRMFWREVKRTRKVDEVRLCDTRAHFRRGTKGGSGPVGLGWNFCSFSRASSGSWVLPDR